MRKVRAGLVMMLVAGVLLLGGNRAEAVIGIPDDVPGATLLYPFFKVNPTPSGTSRQDSLIVITNTANTPSLTAVDALVHITIWSTKSQHIYDFTVALTEHDVWSCSLLDLLVNPNNVTRPCGVSQAPTSVTTDLRVGNILAGYVTADVVNDTASFFPGQPGVAFLARNILIGHLYLVDLPAGSATGFNAVSLEAITPLVGHPAAAVAAATQSGFYMNRCIEEQGVVAACAPATYANRERIDGPAGNAAQTLAANAQPVVAAADDAPLSLIVRYFSLTDVAGRSEVWLWKDRNTAGKRLNLAVYDEAEIVHSISFPVPDEVNFSPTESIITPGAPGGWFRLKFVCGEFGYCDYDEATPGATWGTQAAPETPIQAVAYSLQFAQSSNATLRWDAAFPAHRQYTNYVGGIAEE